MGTIIECLKNGNVPEFLDTLAEQERIDMETMAKEVISGRMVVLRNNRNTALDPIAVGNGARIKINANVGASPVQCDFGYEMDKLKAAKCAGADAVMDLSISGEPEFLRRRIIEELNMPLGTVPIYEAALGLKRPEELTPESYLKVVERQAAQGVDFMTIHSGFLKKHIELTEKRVIGVVSRGGAIMARWMKYHGKENFLYDRFDDILSIAHEYDVTLSLGDGLRPGCTADASDAAQFGELEVLGELTERCRSADVQVMIEGPGHVPLNLIEENVRKAKKICHEAPFYVLGPLVMDYAAGYDHIAGAVGGALAAYFGADFLCYVTPAEHLRLPSISDVKEGVIASKIAACAADLAKRRPDEIQKNLEMSIARKNFDWETQKRLSLDAEKFDEYLEKVVSENSEADGEAPCSMCGEWCAVKRTGKNSVSDN